MSHDIDIADFVVHLHPELSADDMTRLEQGLRSHTGVISVHFNSSNHPHALLVAYNPEETSSEALLAEIRAYDQEAVMVSL